MRTHSDNTYRLNNGHKCDMGFNIASAALYKLCVFTCMCIVLELERNVVRICIIQFEGQRRWLLNNREL